MRVLPLVFCVAMLGCGDGSDLPVPDGGNPNTQAQCDDLSVRWNVGTMNLDRACRVDSDCRLLGAPPTTNNCMCVSNIAQGCGSAVAKSAVAPLIDQLSTDYFARCGGAIQFDVCGCAPMAARCLESRCAAVPLTACPGVFDGGFRP